MSATTVFLLQILGPAFLAGGISIAVNRDYFVSMLKHFSEEKMTMYTMSLMMMIAGLALVVKHNLWGNLAEGLVSFIGWATFIKGVMYMLFPTPLMNMAKKMRKSQWLNVGGFVWLLAGLYMTYTGFFL